MTRGSSRAGVGAGRIVSGAVTGVVIRYVRERKRPGRGPAIARGGPEHRRAQRSRGPDRAGPRRTRSSRCSTRPHAFSRDPEVARHLGGEMLEAVPGHRDRGVAAIDQNYRVPFSRLHRRHFGRLSRTVEIELVEEGKRSCRRARTHTQGAFSRPLYMCDFTKGFLARCPRSSVRRAMRMKARSKRPSAKQEADASASTGSPGAGSDRAAPRSRLGRGLDHRDEILDGAGDQTEHP